MKSTKFKLLILSFSLSLSCFAQQFTKPLQEFKVGNNTNISIEASYAEIEIVEWNKNKVEIEGIMNIQGLPENEAKAIFDSWDISAQADAENIRIRSSSSKYGNEYFFINHDKYQGNVIVDLPDVGAMVVDIMDSMNFVLPEFENFPDIDFNMSQNFQIHGDSLSFDYEEFQKNSEYLKQWQEEHKEEMKRLKVELKESQAKIAKEQKEIQKELREVQREAMEEAREAQRQAMEEARKAQREALAEARIAQKEVRRYNDQERARMIAEGARVRESEVQRIMRDRQKVKIKKKLRIKVPRNAKLEMDVDYCKISTIN